MPGAGDKTFLDLDEVCPRDDTETERVAMDDKKSASSLYQKIDNLKLSSTNKR